MTSLPKVCIIGAGSSGIAAAKALHERGIPFDCFEKSDRVGGNWVFGNKNGMSSAYRDAAHQHLARAHGVLGLPDAEVVSRTSRTTPRSRATSTTTSTTSASATGSASRPASSTPRGATTACGRSTLDGAARRARYDALLVANGHHWDPRWPEPPFPGATLRRRADALARLHRPRRACAASASSCSAWATARWTSRSRPRYVAEATFLAARRGAHVIPKYLFGKPLDQLWRYGADRPARRPARACKVRQAMLQRRIGTWARWSTTACPSPTTDFGEAHPTISGRILDRLAHGDDHAQAEHRRARGRPRPLRRRHRRGGRRRRLLHRLQGHASRSSTRTSSRRPTTTCRCSGACSTPRSTNVFFVGLLQPLGAIMPLAEAQGQWIADYLRGDYALPAPTRDARGHRSASASGCSSATSTSKRHTMQVDFDDYLCELERERAAGADRARAQGFRLPIEPRAERLAGDARPAPA